MAGEQDGSQDEEEDDWLKNVGIDKIPETLDEAEEAFLRDRLKLYQDIMARPCVMGADLVRAGLRPGPAFSDVLAFAHDLHLSGVEKEKALPQVLAYAREKGISPEN